MKIETIYTDGGFRRAESEHVPTRSRLRRNRSGMTTGAAGGEVP